MDLNDIQVALLSPDMYVHTAAVYLHFAYPLGRDEVSLAVDVFVSGTFFTGA